MYQQLAIKYYSNHKDLHKAIAAGKAIDNALKLDYSKSGVTNCHFMMSNYLKYFDYDKLKQLQNDTKTKNS